MFQESWWFMKIYLWKKHGMGGGADIDKMFFFLPTLVWGSNIIYEACDFWLCQAKNRQYFWSNQSGYIVHHYSSAAMISTLRDNVSNSVYSECTFRLFCYSCIFQLPSEDVVFLACIIFPFVILSKPADPVQLNISMQAVLNYIWETRSTWDLFWS